MTRLYRSSSPFALALVFVSTSIIAEETRAPSLTLLEYLGQFTDESGELFDPLAVQDLAQVGSPQSQSESTATKQATPLAPGNQHLPHGAKP